MADPSVTRAPVSRPATNAPSVIGSLVASLGIVELQKLLAEAFEQVLMGRELYLDARHHQHYVTRLARNPQCLFDHETWALIEAGQASGLELGEVLGLGGAPRSETELGVEGDVFAGEPACLDCGRRRQLWKLRRRLAPADLVCGACGGPLAPSGFEVVEWLSAKRLRTELLHRPLATFGLRPGDVFSLRAAGVETHYRLAPESPAPSSSGATVVVAGCGNIGSHLVSHIARTPAVGRVVLVDPDVYEARNLTSQDIRAADVGRPKVEVQAERLREIRPELDVVAVAEPLENLPLSCFLDAFLMGALDSRLARQQLNQVAWRAGSPWIDMAVDGPALLCRVSVYVPDRAGCQTPCLECGWDPDDYRLLYQSLPCDEIPVTQEPAPARWRESDGEAGASGETGEES
jgi:hypothetical protein